jgi:GT2 family glycosyltransferase
VSTCSDHHHLIDVSVIISAHNAAATLGEQLDALMEQKWSGTWEIVIADNGSTDDTALLVNDFAERDSRVRLVEASGGVGAGYARIVAMEHAAGRRSRSATPMTWWSPVGSQQWERHSPSTTSWPARSASTD